MLYLSLNKITLLSFAPDTTLCLSVQHVVYVLESTPLLILFFKLWVNNLVESGKRKNYSEQGGINAEERELNVRSLWEIKKKKNQTDN